MVGSSAMRHVNSGLLAVSVALALYIVGAPFFPDATFRVASLWASFTGADSNGSLTSFHHGTASDPIPQDDRLVIPSIGVDGEINEGRGVDTLQKGIWRRPKTSTPDKGGNTVLVAHRFLYTSGSKTFYHLDKVKVGDPIAIYWKGKEYRYEVTETKVVLPTALEIEKPTPEPILTLYTCTPLLTGIDRLVVVAKLVSPL